MRFAFFVFVLLVGCKRASLDASAPEVPRDISRDSHQARALGRFMVREDMLVQPGLVMDGFERTYTVTDARGVARVMGSYTDETRVGWHSVSRIGRYLVILSTSHVFAVDVSAGDLSNPRLVSFQPFQAEGFRGATEGTISSVTISGSTWRVHMELGSAVVEESPSFVSYDDGVSFELELGRGSR